MSMFMLENAETDAIVEVYKHLQDDQSREIYEARSLFSLTDDRRKLKAVVRKMVAAKYMIDELEKHNEQKKVLFGAGTWGKAILEHFDDIIWSAIVDNKKAGEEIGYATKIISMEDMCKFYSDAVIVIAVMFQWKEIERQLLDAGIESKNIIVPAKIVEEKQYFDLPFLSHETKEVFVDAGGYSGDTAKSFIKWCKGIYGEIIIFEPIEKNYLRCSEVFEGTGEQVIIENKGIWSKSASLSFLSEEESSRVKYDNGEYQNGG